MKVIAISFEICYDTSNERADGMANHDRDNGSFYRSLNKSKLFSGEALIITPVCSEHLQNLTRDHLQQIDSFIERHIRPEQRGKREDR